jgi:hypothetical protein
VEDAVRAECADGVAGAVAPRPELLQDAGALARRGVGQGVAERLRAGALDRVVAGVDAAVVLGSLQAAPLPLCVVGRWPVVITRSERTRRVRRMNGRKSTRRSPSSGEVFGS